MRRGRGFQDLKWRAEAAGYGLARTLVRLLPIDLASALGAGLMRLFGPLTGAHRTALANLYLAFPDWTEAERRAMARRQWGNFGRVCAEFFLMDRILADPGRVEYPSEAE